MNNTVVLPNRERVQEQAAQWLAAMDRGLSAQEKHELRDWLSASSLHAETLVHYASAWDLMDILAPIAELLPLSVPPKPSKRRNLFPALTTAIAASLVTAALVLFEPWSSTSTPELRFSAAHTTQVGEQSEVVLPDQSRLKLNTDTRLKVTYTASARSVELLSGEAYFDVAKDPQRPFVVVAGGRSVTAVGTAFNVELRDQSAVEVLVTEGKVAISDSVEAEAAVHNAITGPAEKKESIYLTVGQKVQLDVAGRGPVTTIEESDVETSLAWQQGMVVFQGESLEQVLAEISRYTSADFEIVDNTIKNIEVGGFFKAGDTDQLLFVLKHNFGIHSQLSGNTWLLSQTPTSKSERR
ncbi:FecR domain-containing protein [bacterium SCSIO 12696]|nr:FecR domain-containing protein [bacterium SCSIO 12696]